MPHEAPSISQDQQNKISPVLLPSQVYVFEGPTRRNFWFSWRHSFSKFTIYTYLQFLHVIVSHLLPLHAWTGSWYCVVWETNVEGSRVKVFNFFFLELLKKVFVFLVSPVLHAILFIYLLQQSAGSTFLRLSQILEVGWHIGVKTTQLFSNPVTFAREPLRWFAGFIMHRHRS